MRVALVAQAVHQRGGTERWAAELATGLLARGHEVVIFAAEKDPALLPGVPWHRVPMPRRPSALRYISFLIGNTLVRALARRRGERFDVLHATGADVLHPTVTTLHCCARAMAEAVEREPDRSGRQRLAGPRRLGNALAYRLIAPMERYVVRRGAGRVVTVSSALAREIERHNGPLGARLAVVPNGVDLAAFSPDVRADRPRLRRALDLPAEAGVILFVGYNWERKGLATLIEALARLGPNVELPPPYLVVVGGRGQPAHERRLQERLGGRARFLGARADLPALYGAADICALPSLEEPFGLPILEAMACGLPIVVSRRAGVSELISDDVDGFILEDPRDAEALAGLLGELLGSAERRADVGSRARRTAERYAWGEVARRMERVYLDALVAREPAGAEAR